MHANLIRLGLTMLAVANVGWLFIEVYYGLTNIGVFVIICVIVGMSCFFFDGYKWTGFLKNRIEIKNNGSDTKIFVEFENLIGRNGWIAIAVNDFFDSNVNEVLVSSNSLHGEILNKFWPKDRNNWKKQIRTSLKNEPRKKVARSKGNKLLFPIGSTGCATKENNKFLFVALGKTDPSSNVTTASAEALICAVRGMLSKARVVCSNEPLSIPLMGSGLSRTGIKKSVLVDLMITAILEETKNSKVTDTITIVLPVSLKGEINLKNYLMNWN